MKKILLLVAVVLVGVGLLAFLIAAALGYFPGLSKTLGFGGPKDLGVEYTDDDYLSAKDKLDEATETQVVDTTFTDAEVTALMNSCTESACIVEDVQVRTSDEGRLEMSGTINREKATTLLLNSSEGTANEAAMLSLINYLPAQPAFYFEAEVVAENDVFVVDVQQASLAGIQVTDESLEQLSDEVMRLIGDYFASVPGTQIESLTVAEGGITLQADLQNVDEEGLY